MSLLNIPGSLSPHSDAGSVDPSEVVGSFVSQFTVVRYLFVATLTALVYHSIITLDKEIKYFWPNPRSSASIVYFVNRYVGLLGAICNTTVTSFTPNLAECSFAYWGGGLAELVNIVTIDYILLIRVLALFYGEKKLSIALKILLGMETCICLSILIYCDVFEGFIVTDLSENPMGCGVRRLPPRVPPIISRLVPIIYGLILLSLALYKAAEYWKLSAGFTGFHLVRVLIQDQVIYYGFVVFCSVCKIVGICILESSPSTAYVLAAVGSPTFLCILGGQLLINLKEAGERGANVGTNYSPRIGGGINFGENDAANEADREGDGSI